ncbi:MAG: ribonuclease III [Bacillota bacterium]|nr:ribonuclease III [Bacillota bacterium]
MSTFRDRLSSALTGAGLDIDQLSGLDVALTHTSYVHETGAQCEHNERLEFLGDAVFGLAVAEELFHGYPDADPGELTRLRAGVVSGDALAAVARRLGIGEDLRLGRGEDQSGGRQRLSNLGRAMEAVIGAVYLSVGYDATKRLVRELLGTDISAASSDVTHGDPKSALQELVQACGQSPSYRVVSHSGPDHAPEWVVEAEAGGLVACGRGGSRRQAEQDAADRLLGRLRSQEPPERPNPGQVQVADRGR